MLPVATEHLEISIVGQTPDTDEGASVVVRHAGVNIQLLLIGQGADVEAQVLVAASPTSGSRAELMVTTGPIDAEMAVAQILVGEREIIHMRLDGQRVRIEGGTLVYRPDATPMGVDEQQ
jgi:hypothetical protein